MFVTILFYAVDWTIDKILDNLGKGSYGKVRKAIHLSTQKYYAVKIMEVENDTNRKVADIEQENFLRLQNSSPYLINIIECFEEVLFLFMNLLYF
jgi:serine/threonine protein kinase